MQLTPGGEEGGEELLGEQGLEKAPEELFRERGYVVRVCVLHSGHILTRVKLLADL